MAKEGATFTVVGTYGYSPLEQLGGRATLASDLYALGATLIHLLTGVAPAELPQTNGRLQFAVTLNLNPGFVRWLWQLTEANVERRFTTARQALDALEANEAAIYGSVTVKPANSPIQLHKSRQRLELRINDRHFNFKTFGTYLRFDSQSFEICWSWFGLSRRKQGRITDIDRISPGELLGREIVLPAVSITVGVHEHLITSVNPPLTPAEHNWLLQELRQWLGLTTPKRLSNQAV